MGESRVEVSVAIPTFAETDYDAHLLRRLMESLANQREIRMDVVIADHSLGTHVESVLGDFEKQLDITYFRNNEDRGYSRRNLNVALALATGRYVKPMDMDDCLEDPYSLSKMFAAADENRPNETWVVAGFTGKATDGGKLYGPIVPSLKTTLGPPSTLLFPNNKLRPILLHQHLLIVNDHELQQQLLLTYGVPLIISDPLVAIGHHDGQVSQRVNLEQLAIERKYFQLSQKLVRASNLAAWEMIQPSHVRKERHQKSHGFARRLARSVARMHFAVGRRLTRRSYELTLLQPTQSDGSGPITFQEHRRRRGAP